MLAAYASRLAETKAFGGTAVRARIKVPCIPGCGETLCLCLLQWFNPGRRKVVVGSSQEMGQAAVGSRRLRANCSC